MSADAEARAEVLLDLPARSVDRQLTYRIPSPLDAVVEIGSRVVVPLGARTARGFVIARSPADPGAGRVLREILSVVDRRPLFSPRMLELARWIADHTVSTLLEAVHCLAPAELFRRRTPARLRHAVLAREDGRAARTGPRQARILDALRARGEVPVDDLWREGGRAALRRLIVQGAVLLKDAPAGARQADPPRSEPSLPERSDGHGMRTLIWGDASARRAWMLAQARAALDGGGQALIIVPEIALVPPFVQSFRPAFGQGLVPFHSGMTARERQAAWERCGSQDARVVVGTRSALFLPLRNVRLIAVDDEHDPVYRADSAPRYHARDVARRRAELDGARLALGSLAPSVETYAEVAAGRMACVRLPATAPRAKVVLVDLRDERARGHRGLLTRPLVAAMRQHLRAGSRVALFVNRAGYTRALLCEECGAAVRCPGCGVAVPYERERRTVSCRICGLTAPAPGTCPRCGGVRLRGVGPGTERVEEVVRRLFPSLGIARLDRETGAEFDRIAQEFGAGRIRLLVGTRMLLRAGELRPSLVGVIDADFALHLPDFRGAERTVQQLRAVTAMPTGGPGPEAVLQTRMPDHPALRAVATGEDDAVYRRELETRRELGFPPYTFLARVIAAGKTREAASALASTVARSASALGVEVLGPAPAYDRAARAMFQQQCLLRGPDPAAVRAAARAALGVPAGKGGRVTVEVDPQEFH